VHLFHSENPSTLFQLYLAARKHFTAGGPTRIRHTLPPLIFRSLQLIVQIKILKESSSTSSSDTPSPIPLDDETWNRTGKRVFQFAHELVTSLSQTPGLVSLSLRLFLQCALAASNCAFETIAKEFFTRAFGIYEEKIADSKTQREALLLIISTLQKVDCFTDEDNYTPLVTKTALQAANLISTPDQSLAVSLCSHLFWSKNAEEGTAPGRIKPQDGRRVLECLQKALKIAGTGMDVSENVALFVNTLNEYLYYFELGVQDVKATHISTLVTLINNNLSAIPDPTQGSVPATNTFYQNTLQYIRRMKRENPLFREVDVN